MTIYPKIPDPSECVSDTTCPLERVDGIVIYRNTIVWTGRGRINLAGIQRRAGVGTCISVT